MHDTHSPHSTYSVDTLNELGRVTLPGEITMPVIARVVDCLSQLHSGYHYSELRLRLLDNQGGQITALNALCAELRALQDRGVVISTEGLGMVFSAAAVALSMGTLGHRRVDPGAVLVYHLSRTSVSQGLTARVARQLNDRLTETDESMLQQLASHVVPLSYVAPVDDSGEPTWVWPREPVQAAGVLRHAPVIQQRFASREACRDHIARALATVFEEDAVMTAEQAVALGLIDGVGYLGSPVTAAVH